MKNILAEIKALESKVANSSAFEEYKKRHPGTKKSPSDEMFQPKKSVGTTGSGKEIHHDSGDRHDAMDNNPRPGRHQDEKSKFSTDDLADAAAHHRIKMNHHKAEAKKANDDEDTTQEEHDESYKYHDDLAKHHKNQMESHQEYVDYAKEHKRNNRAS